MESIYLGIVIFLFLLAIFDLTVGVSNDAVNFLNSAIGAKAASFKTIILIAAVGIFCGATMSNGMMEIARHGIFRPEAFHFNELMCIFLAVMVTDVCCWISSIPWGCRHRRLSRWYLSCWEVLLLWLC